MAAGAMIGVVDYGLGNLASVAGAVERLGFEPRVSSDPDFLGTCDKLILPGVGAFGDGMRNLRESGGRRQSSGDERISWRGDDWRDVVDFLKHWDRETRTHFADA